MSISAKLAQTLIIGMSAAALILAQSCSSPTPSQSKEVQFASGQSSGGQITEGQLQDSIFRFANRFSGRVNHGLGDLANSPDKFLRDQSLLRRLVYNSSALDICLGPSPQANLLDMIAFIDLSRSVWKDYWAPKVFKDQAEEMTKGFDDASQEIWKIAATVMNPKQLDQLNSVIKRWKEKNPDQIAVENVRLSDFSKESGVAAQSMNEDVGGLLAGVQRATQVGDRALLFSERALFYAQRAPFLWRLQAQAGTHEVLSEARSTLDSGQGIIEQEPQIRSLLTDLRKTFASMSESLNLASKHPETMSMAATLLTQFSETLREMNKTLANPNYPHALSQLAGVSGSIDQSANRFLWKLFGVGALLILIFGLISLLSRLAFFWLTSRTAKNRKLRSRLNRVDRAA